MVFEFLDIVVLIFHSLMWLITHYCSVIPVWFVTLLGDEVTGENIVSTII